MRKIEDLRNHLFDTIEALKRDKDPMDLDRAKTIAEVGRVLVDSAKAEVDMLRATGAKVGSGFIPLPQLEGGAHPRLAPPPPIADEGKGYTGKINGGAGR